MTKDELKKTRGRYKTNKKIRNQIDRILHTNAMLFQNLGIDTTDREKTKIKKIEWDNLQMIKQLDFQFYKRVCPYPKNHL